ncbi:entericidin [Sinorhizobium medicae]|uniref:Entericidin n=2 Tax=Sinorhizobium medicae TaxID=110321 RepID=A0A6G1WJ64_9HYPH|nr:entericidin [Sinorhizobium medicae]ABR60613.1 Entericidin EcnAB [Sinorhizobium medicae WSM419]MBO1944063.1 entericidin [Sinorhizobium medicae]MBO1965070.1 entericidin [Sinorhizobium medicae]MDX0406540.1 entericidin [Sinorhizobium medicae]MDX0413091.1 entericidin [Sinorhizobium medicae]
MPNTVIASLCIVLIVASSCANTAHGFREDSAQTGHAVDRATHRVLGAGAQ